MAKRANILKICLALALAVALSCVLASCGDSDESGNKTPATYEGRSFVLGNLSVIAYDQELVYDTSQQRCLAVYLHVTNNGKDPESVIGSYNVRRFQGDSGTLKVGIAYNTEGDAIHTGGKRIEPGESKDVAICFVLKGEEPVTMIFGDEERGITETTLTFSVAELILAESK